MDKKPEEIKLSDAKIEKLSQKIESGSLTKEDQQLLIKLLKWVSWVNKALQLKSISMKRFKRMIFGPKTEKKNKDKDDKPKGGGSSGQSSSGNRTGGKNGHDKYPHAERVYHPHESAKKGELCPACGHGHLYELKPLYFISFEGQPPIKTTRHEFQRLRCSGCGAVFTPSALEEIRKKKYKESTASVLALMRYGFGVPHTRLEKFQRLKDCPLPSSTQWDILDRAAKPGYPVYKGLMKFAADGQLLYNDDTGVRILSVMAEPKKEKERKGTQTTAMVAIRDKIKVSLFMSGRKHAGENLKNIIALRNPELDKIMTMNDAASKAMPKDLLAEICNCMTHGRRKFTDLEEDFPQEVRHVVRLIGQVYHNDSVAKRMEMDDLTRLKYHQQRSSRPMKRLHKWCYKMIARRKVEDNSALGGSIKYMLNHWPELSKFLAVAGAPLDNNICEILVKTAIRHRKNSLFYKTEHGALIGDIYMSLIQTCLNVKVDPFKYLTELQLNIKEVFKSPSSWFPWNYQSNLVTA